MVTAEIDTASGRIVVECTYAESEGVKLVPGHRWDSVNRRWTLPLAVTSCFSLQGAFNNQITVGPKLTQWYDEQATQWLRACRWLAHPGVLELPPADSIGQSSLHETIALLEDIQGERMNEGDLHLKPYQAVASAFMLIGQRAIYGAEMGCGKTPTTLVTIEALAEQCARDTFDAAQRPFPALIVCPDGLKRNWANEVRRWLPDVPYELLSGTPTQRRKAIERVANEQAGILIAGYKGILSFSRLAPYGSIKLKKCAECDPNDPKPVRPSSCEYHERELNLVPWQVVIADEAHRLKDPTAKQTRALKWIARHANYRWALTGTPSPEDPVDIWSLLNFINPDEWPTKSGFIDRYCIPEYNPWGAPKNFSLNLYTEAELRKTLDARFIRHIKDVVLPYLPKKVYETRYTTLSDKERKAYNEMKKALVAEVEGGTLTAFNSLSKTARLAQMAASQVEISQVICPKCKGEGHELLYGPNGGVSLENGTPLPAQGPECSKCFGTGAIDLVTPIEGSSKLDTLDELLEDLGTEPVVLFFVSRKLLELYADRLRKREINFGRVHGEIDEESRQNAVDAFQTGQLRYLLLTTGAGGEGLNLTRARTAVFVQRPWSLVQSRQAEDRIHRIGAEVHESLLVIDIVTEDTIEEQVRVALVEKGEDLESVVQDRERIKWLVNG